MCICVLQRKWCSRSFLSVQTRYLSRFLVSSSYSQLTTTNGVALKRVKLKKRKNLMSRVVITINIITLRIFILQELKRLCASSQLVKSTKVVLISFPSCRTTVENLHSCYVQAFLFNLNNILIKVNDIMYSLPTVSISCRYEFRITLESTLHYQAHIAHTQVLFLNYSLNL